MTGLAPFLAIDTATSQAVVALGTPDGVLIGAEVWPAGQRHSEELLPRVARLLTGAGLQLEDLVGIVVGTGPGGFTGLRVGLATAKTLAQQLAVPLAGVSSGSAMLAAARAGWLGDAPPGDESREPGPAALIAGEPAPSPEAWPRVAGPVPLFVLLLPAGSSDRILVRNDAPPVLLPGEMEPELPAGARIVAVDLAGRASASESAQGAAAQAGLAAALVRLGAARLAAGPPDDPAALVPEYVTLPRGIASAQGEIAWSRDHR
jgi:tRNA threonylcarbamoyladenosine biosynthesis protein TsaB